MMWVVNFFFIFCRFRIPMQKSWCYKLIIPTFILKDFSQNLEDIVQFNSVAQSCPALCNPINHSMPGLPVHHQLLESTQTHVHWVGDAIQPFHPLPSPSPPALNLSQHQGLFKCGDVIFSVLSLIIGSNTQLKLTTHFP